VCVCLALLSCQICYVWFSWLLVPLVGSVGFTSTNRSKLRCCFCSQSATTTSDEMMISWNTICVFSYHSQTRWIHILFVASKFLISLCCNCATESIYWFKLSSFVSIVWFILEHYSVASMVFVSSVAWLLQDFELLVLQYDLLILVYSM
jgi:hypothetical protein